MKKPKRRQQVKKVWRIFRFKERFELKEDVRFCRSGPLLFIRDYVGSGQDDEAIKYKQQIAICESAPNRYELLFVFWKLREIAANHSRAYRGYLLDEKFEPASINKISVWVGIDVKKTERIMKQLEQIGLIEQVKKPEFDLSENELPGRKHGSKSRKSSRAHRTARARSRKNVTARNALKKEGKYKTESKKVKKKITKSGSDRARPGNPTNPNRTDGEAGQERNIISKPLPRRSYPGYTDIESLGDVLNCYYNPDCHQFALDVIKAAGIPFFQDSLEYKQEFGVWKKAWALALSTNLSPAELAELRDRFMTECSRIKRRRNKPAQFKKSPERVLRWLFGRLLEAAVAKSVPVSAKGTG